MHLPKHFYTSALLVAAMLATALITAAFYTGATFGQQCAKQHTVDTPRWHNCVADMAAGKMR